MAADAMRIIEPPASGDPAVALLKQLNAFLETKPVLEKLKDLTRENDKSVRVIQGNRFEIFLQARSKVSTVFDWIASEMIEQGKVNEGYTTPQKIKDTIFNYAKSQAKKDSRLKNHVYKFDNFSLLVSYGKVDAQFEHIDLLQPNHQFGLVVTDKSHGTIVYKPAYPVRNVQQLKQAWKDLPGSVAKAIQNNHIARHLVEQFGDVLCPQIQEVSPMARTLKTGTLCSLPGSIIHAGPACRKFRAVLFFSAWPENHAAAEYNPDTQYFAPLLCCDLVSLLWSQLGVDDRCFLLTKLADSMRLSKYKNLYRHLSDKSMIGFTKDLGWAQYGKGQRDSFIKEFASREGPVGDIFDGNNTVEASAFEGMELVSVDGLMAEYEGDPYPVKIYRCVKDDSIRLYYPHDKSWEGGDKGYTLRMNKRKRNSRQLQLFDGHNGTLKDDEGEEIVCYCNK